MSRVRRHLPGGGESGRFLGRAGLGVLLVVLLTATATATAAMAVATAVMAGGADRHRDLGHFPVAVEDTDCSTAGRGDTGDSGSG